MSTKTYTPEQRAADGEIAKAMGWREIELHISGQCAVVPPEYEDTEENRLRFLGRSIYALVPEFHTDENARRTLLIWLAADEGRWRAFIFQFYLAGPEDLRAAFLATPAQVAEAALRVIKKSEGGKA